MAYDPCGRSHAALPNPEKCDQGVRRQRCPFVALDHVNMVVNIFQKSAVLLGFLKVWLCERNNASAVRVINLLADSAVRHAEVEHGVRALQGFSRSGLLPACSWCRHKASRCCT
jgi:hypothetical protein